MENKVISKEYVEKNFVSKKKIEEKIKEVNKIIDEDKDFINKNLNVIDGDVVNWYYQKVDLNVRIRNVLEELLED